MADEHRPEENAEAGYEVADADVRQVVMAGIGLAVATAIACFAMYFLFNMLKFSGEREQRQTLNPMAGPRTLPPEPRLQVRPWEEIQNLRMKEDQVLNTYGWTNKGAGMVRIPIEKAMEIVAQRGLPSRVPGQPAQTASPAATGGRAGQPQAASRNSASPHAPALKEGGNAPRK
jgi:hypothetical protein